jgi:hypothetical protein
VAAGRSGGHSAAAHPGQVAVCLFSLTVVRPGAQTAVAISTIECDHHGVYAANFDWWDNRTNPFTHLHTDPQVINFMTAGRAQASVSFYDPGPVGHRKASYCHTVAPEGHVAKSGCIGKAGPA